MESDIRIDRRHGIVHKADFQNRFVALFTPRTGFYMRTGVLDENGNDTDVDPFQTAYPELIDIGIMGHCIHGSKGLCLKAGVQCYQDGRNIKKPNMNLEDFKSLIDQTRGRVFQVALGGRGDPNKHEDFKGILEHCREKGVVPNYTTSGLDLTDDEIELTKEHCGAVAVSWYRQQHTWDAVQRFLKAEVKTNIHYVLGQNTIDEAINRLSSNLFPSRTNAVIFLLHKPVGLGTAYNVLQHDDPRVARFFSLIDTVKTHHKIGFDSCSIPGILNFSSQVHEASIDTCEGARWSMYVSSDMQALPCSFDQEHRWAVDLRENSIEQAWNSTQFEDFRSALRDSCPTCDKKSLCMGGCPIRHEIVLCEEV